MDSWGWFRYGNDGGMDYWKLRSQWGAAWGELGYLRIERGKGSIHPLPPSSSIWDRDRAFHLPPIILYTHGIVSVTRAAWLP